jgi:hypothetical protein
VSLLTSCQRDIDSLLSAAAPPALQTATTASLPKLAASSSCSDASTSCSTRSSECSATSSCSAAWTQRVAGDQPAMCGSAEPTPHLGAAPRATASRNPGIPRRERRVAAPWPIRQGSREASSSAQMPQTTSECALSFCMCHVTRAVSRARVE